MHPQLPLTSARRERILSKLQKASARRMKIKKRTGQELESASAWCGLWMHALGIQRFF